VDLLAWTLRARFAQRALFKTVALRHMDEAALDAYVTPLIEYSGVRHDLARFLRGVSNRYTLEAARFFPEFGQPVLIAWGDRDLFFSPQLALRLQSDFPDARVEAVIGSRAFVPEDSPGQLERLIEEFSKESVSPSRTGGDSSQEEAYSGD
jgi:pimeloyl-ACP methyl ester carboxylesterase